MKLANDFYKIISISETQNGFLAKIELNRDHIVYTGHFPGHPVTPGAIQLLILHELLEKKFSIKLKLETILQCKFLKIMNPEKTPQIIVKIDCDSNGPTCSVKSSATSDNELYFKVNAVYHVLEYPNQQMRKST
ncbi:MAG: hypothetical protein IPM48_09655 [Saprospiraceae bacterium]|nr:hypothetical protein [Saprospiraceae bacterium]